MNSALQFRHELKYAVSKNERALQVARLHGLLERDEHTGRAGVYRVRSLYFDDYFHTAYADKLSGVSARAKYRIRCYNESDAHIRLERKLKRGSYIAKQSVALTREECDKLISGDCGFLLDRVEPLCTEFYYEHAARILRPQVIVDYEREPFVFRTGDVRVTFDSEVRALPGTYPFFERERLGVLALEPGTLILEIKFTQLLPRYIKTLLPGRHMQLTAFSKYAECCDALSPALIALD